jgi:hypothetical protein
MNPADNARWQDRLLDQVFAAIAAHPALTEILIFKGARILAHHLPGVTRQSLDLDANCRRAFLDTFIDRERQAAVLRQYLAEAVNAHFEAQSPVTLELGEIRVFTKPPKGHPRGWNAFEVRIRVVDRSRPSQLGVPTLELDVASPEAMSADSLTTLQVGGHAVHTYSLPRIAGEKVRAFLSSLPDYQRKSGRSGGAIRVKDLYDLTQVVRHRPLLDTAFWRTAASEFRLACTSRFVDCAGWSAFDAHEALVRATFTVERVLPDDVDFETAWTTLRLIVEAFEASGVVPIDVPMPPLP